METGQQPMWSNAFSFSMALLRQHEGERVPGKALSREYIYALVRAKQIDSSRV